jgi:hypothetical protein
MPQAEVSPEPGQVLFDQIAEAYLDRPGVRLGRMMSSQGLTVDGRIFALAVRGRLVVKVSADRVAEETTDGRGAPFEPRPGRRMREWLSVPYSPGAVGRKRWSALVADAFDFVASATAHRS